MIFESHFANTVGRFWFPHEHHGFFFHCIWLGDYLWLYRKCSKNNWIFPMMNQISWFGFFFQNIMFFGNMLKIYFLVSNKYIFIYIYYIYTICTFICMYFNNRKWIYISYFMCIYLTNKLCKLAFVQWKHFTIPKSQTLC